MIPQQSISIQDYTYDLPNELIAYHPSEVRGASKQLIYKAGKITDDVFQNIENHLPENALLVFNNTKVINARLHFTTETGALVEVFVLEPSEGEIIEDLLASKKIIKIKCLVGNLKRWKNEFLILSTNHFILKVKKMNVADDGLVLQFEWNNDFSFIEVLDECGKIPLPPYIKREATESDKIQYQTVVANNKGSVAAPTAALHFTTQKLNELKAKGIESVNITLHVGAGTFKQVKSDTMQGHQMHSEEISLSVAALKTIYNHVGPIVAVGTTSARTLESLYWLAIKYKNTTSSNFELLQWEAYELKSTEEFTYKDALEILIGIAENNHSKNFVAKTSLIIAPGYSFKIIHSLITNFHQPQSTLLLLVAALVGDKWKNIYQHAIENNYRFFSYGDSSYLVG